MEAGGATLEVMRTEKSMHAMVLNKVGGALEWTELADRQPGAKQIRVKVGACGVCRTDLHVVDGELAHPQVPIIPRHEIGGRIATAAIADARFAFPLGEAGSDESIAPLLCAGLIGWRSLSIAGDGKHLGLYGFGAAAHILAQVAKWQ